MTKIRNALISVSYKKGIVEFAEALHKLGVKIISTGGTAKVLTEHSIPVTLVSEITGYPELFNGRVKTLHPMIFGSLLARADVESDVQTLEDHKMTPIEMVVVNLYPFEETVSNGSVSVETAIEQIDIGGPSMIRAAAKNFKDRAVIVNPHRYDDVISELQQNDRTLQYKTLMQLAREAFQYTAHYDTVIARYFESLTKENAYLPEVFSLSLNKESPLRYGENPHQKAAMYGNLNRYFQKLHGKELSFNNILDLQAAAQLANEFDQPTVTIIKHTNPCGVASDDDIHTAYLNALACDRTSAFGGIVAVNRPLDIEPAKAMDEIFTEVIVAPSFTDDALDLLKQKKNRRLIKQLVDLRYVNEYDIRGVTGGILVQEKDNRRISKEEVSVVTKRQPTKNELESLLFAWRVAKFVKSNAIVFVQKYQTIGIGAGQMSRIDSTKIATMKANQGGFDLKGSVVASDGFFPFADGIEEIANAGAMAVIQPGGSVRDQEVIEAANKHNIAMVFTNVRHFRH